MPRFSLWRNQRGLNYKYIDGIVKQAYTMGGTAVYVHKYLGPKDQGVVGPEFPGWEGPGTKEKEDALQPSKSTVSNEPTNELDIQDLLFLENRDRKYDPHVYELRCHYNITDTDFDLSQFGLMLTSDNIFITFHYNDMIERLGREIVAGDVLELPHLRQEQLDKSKPNINKYYVVADASRFAEGYDPGWYHHIWRIRATMMANQQEYSDILQKEAENAYGEGIGQTLEEIISTMPKDLEIMEAIDEAADAQVSKRKFIHEHLYILPELDANGNPLPFNEACGTICLAYGDGIPPNGATLVGQGTSFPQNPQEGDYFLRTDYKPNVLFRRISGSWRRQEVDWRSKWSAANDVLRRFINASGSMKYQNTNIEIPMKQYLSRVLKPDFK